MALCLKLRDLFAPPGRAVGEAGIKQGGHVLDYGCGPGSYTLAAARLAGETGKVYALDIHPLAVKKVEKAARKNSLANIQTILSDCATGLQDASLDVVLLYDIFHCLSNPGQILKELHRVLKPGGVLSFSDHHMKEEDILSKVTEGGLFSLSNRGEKTYTFRREP
jgi:ubiquinone/menaquinone biosynthesis C-methylase UbiE